MRHTEIIKIIMREERVTQAEIARAIGMASHSGVSRIINRRYGKIMHAADILEVLGYELVIRPAKKEPLAGNEYVLRASDYED